MLEQSTSSLLFGTSKATISFHATITSFQKLLWQFTIMFFQYMFDVKSKLQSLIKTLNRLSSLLLPLHLKILLIHVIFKAFSKDSKLIILVPPLWHGRLIWFLLILSTLVPQMKLKNLLLISLTNSSSGDGRERIR